MAFSYAREEQDNKLASDLEVVVAVELPKKRPPSVRFLMALQNCVFFSACVNMDETEDEEADEEKNKAKKAEKMAAAAATLKRIQAYIYKGLAHFYDSLSAVDAYLHKYISEKKASKPDQPLEAEPLKKFIALLGKAQFPNLNNKLT